MTSRQRDEDRDGDCIIGLHVGSRVFYCHRSTLVNAEGGGSYFARRFGANRNFADDVAYTDANKGGMKVFFIERDGDLFAYILKYLTRLTLNLPPYAEHKHLWKDLRLEAEFFSLDGLSDLLSSTHHCRYHCQENNSISQEGILYWLGTGRGKKEHAQYRNPVRLRGCNESIGTSLLEVSVGCFDHENRFFQDHSDTAMAWNLIQHRLRTDLNSPTLDPLGGSTPLWFTPGTATVRQHPPPLGLAPQGGTRATTVPSPRVLMFGSILVRPTHISLRLPHETAVYEGAIDFATTRESCSINLEASFDGEQWETLELQTETNTLLTPTKMQAMAKEIASIRNQPQAPLLQSTNRLIDVADTFLRRTWKVDESASIPQYYKYFSIVSKNGGSCDLSGVGLELYGDIQDLA